MVDDMHLICYKNSDTVTYENRELSDILNIKESKSF